ncbi:hypothetical protein GUI37_01590 [Helcococcus kunzii]|uniref:hypothetical protein n=1 Tax=Helcococcus kunzii TaxID=40091 RepID=UPI001BAEC3AD|nr:hypothetical protein [Helcococcus kunzii]QUY64279.1 hypothetical protein GUI37_01590 [Helcococcus kunzii]
MAVNGFILDQYVNKNVEIILINYGVLKGILKKDGRKFFLDNKKLTISKIATIKEVEE